MMLTFASSNGTICFRKYAYDPTLLCSFTGIRLENWKPGCLVRHCNTSSGPVLTGLRARPTPSVPNQLAYLTGYLRPQLTIVIEREHAFHFTYRKGSCIDAGVVCPIRAVGHPHEEIGDVPS